MKNKLARPALALACAFVIPHSSFVLAQGTLTPPPGAPAPLFKTLQQVEPRTDVQKLSGDASNLFIINQPGSYYLTANVAGVSGKNGITIASSNVTLDLNGFTLQGVPGSLAGVRVNGTYNNITVRNGTVSAWGGNGVDAYSVGSPRNVVVEHLTVSANGAYGIRALGSSVVRDCLSHNNLSVGIFSNGGVISRCVSSDNGAAGIVANYSVVRDCHVANCMGGIDATFCVVADCQIYSSGKDGIDAVNSVVRDCQVQSSGAYGIYAAPGTVSGCFVQNSVKSGIYVNLPGCQISSNTCNGNNTSGGVTDAGIYIDDSNNRVEDNHVTGSGHAGIQVDSGYANNVVIRNTVFQNAGNNYLGTVNNDFGPIGTAATSTSPWANISH